MEGGRASSKGLLFQAVVREALLQMKRRWIHEPDQACVSISYVTCTVFAVLLVAVVVAFGAVQS